MIQKSSHTDLMKLPYELFKLISNLYPLRGRAAVAEIERVTAPVRANAKKLGLTDEKLNKLLNEK